jgi:uncharacterized protein involved in exopolysaccharide biosynthesis
MTLALLWRHKLLIGAATAGAMLVAAVITLQLPRTYLATASVLVTPAPLKSELTPAVPTAETYRQIAITPAVVEGAIARAGLAGGAGESPSPYEAIARRLRVDVHEERGPYNSVVIGPLLDLTVRDTDADRATRTANAWAESFREISREFKGQSSRQLASVLEERAAAVARSLAEGEAALIAFERQARLDVLEEKAKAQSAEIGRARGERLFLEGSLGTNRSVCRALAAENEKLAAAARGDGADASGLAAGLRTASASFTASQARARDYRTQSDLTLLEADLENAKLAFTEGQEELRRLEDRQRDGAAESQRIGRVLAEAAPEDPAVRELRERYYDALVDADLAGPQLEAARSRTVAARERAAALESQAADKRDELARLEARAAQDLGTYDDLEGKRREVIVDLAARSLEAERLGAEVEAARAREAEIESSAADLHDQLAEARIRHEHLVRELDLARDLHARMAAKAQEARAAEAGDTSDVAIVSQAALPERPIAPNPLLNLVAAALFGVTASSALVILFAARPA